MTNVFATATKRGTHTQKMEVILGGRTVKAFVASPKEFHVVGIVRMGMEYGLLAKTDSGDYVRVNGSQVENLDNQKVKEAIARVCVNGRGESYATSRSQCGLTTKPRGVPTVVVRKHRKISEREVVHSYLRSIEA